MLTMAANSYRNQVSPLSSSVQTTSADPILHQTTKYILFLAAALISLQFSGLFLAKILEISSKRPDKAFPHLLSSPEKHIVY
mmetsp:Transcript_26203/g.19687  ORF Transcript_26203/g.19687 Transcript_26203/m.19687 type:complete len:82 (-) Transcript_26203:1227-1472(-)